MSLHGLIQPTGMAVGFALGFAAGADTAGNGGPDLPPIAALLRPVVGAADGPRGLMQPFKIVVFYLHFSRLLFRLPSFADRLATMQHADPCGRTSIVFRTQGRK